MQVSNVPIYEPVRERELCVVVYPDLHPPHLHAHTHSVVSPIVHNTIDRCDHRSRYAHSQNYCKHSSDICPLFKSLASIAYLALILPTLRDHHLLTSISRSSSCLSSRAWRRYRGARRRDRRWCGVVVHPSRRARRSRLSWRS